MRDTMSDRKSVLVFESTDFDNSWREWKETDALPPPPPGRDVALYLASRLREKGVTAVFDPDDDADDGAWMISVARSDSSFNVFVSRDSVGHPPTDMWIVQVRKRVGCLGIILEFFGRRDFEDVQPIRELLDEVLIADVRCTNTKWLSFAEFTSQFLPVR